LGFTTTVTTIIVSSEYPGYTHNRILDDSRKIHRQKKKGKTHIHTIWNKRNVLGWRCDMTYDPIRITKDSDLAEAAHILAVTSWKSNMPDYRKCINREPKHFLLSFI
jgi:hypothetical protein